MPSSDTQFKPGKDWRGNAGGRPKTPLKDYTREKFMNMSNEEKEEFLKKISPETLWKMAEGNPHQSEDVTLEGKPNLIKRK